MVKAGKSEIKRVLERIRAEMIAYYRGYDTPHAKQIHKLHFEKINIVEKELTKIPTYKNIYNKRMDADHGMHFSKVSYTPKEEKFMKTNPLYLRMERIFKSLFKKEELERKAFLRRIRSNKVFSNEQKVVKSAEISVRERDGCLGLSMDSDFYDLGYFKNYFESRLDYLLAKLGCMIEPWDGSWWIVTVETDKPNLANFKEKYIRKHSYVSKDIKDLR